MNTFSVPTRDQVSPASKEAFDTLKGAMGMVPNLYATIAHSSDGLPRYLAFQFGKTSLSNKEKEAVNLVVSEVNGCIYCQSAHTVIGKMNGFSDDEVFRLRGGRATDTKLNALVVLAKEIVLKKGRASAASMEAFYSAGYNDGNVVDVILQVADKIAMNYLHNLTNIAVDFPLAKQLTQTTAA